MGLLGRDWAGRVMAAEPVAFQEFTNQVESVLSQTLSSSSNLPGFEVIWIKGEAERSPAGRSARFPLSEGDSLEEGEKLYTDELSYVTFFNYPDWAAALDQSSHLEVEDQGVQLFEGNLYIKTVGPKPGGMKINDSLGQIIPVGTEFHIQVDTNLNRVQVTVAAGKVEFPSSTGPSVTVLPNQVGILEDGQTPKVNPEEVAFNRTIQSMLHYPAVLDLADLKEIPGNSALESDPALTNSLAAYRRGDVLGAFDEYPEEREPSSDAERLYGGALFLAVGRVHEMEKLLAPLRIESSAYGAGAEISPASQLAWALERATQAVRFETEPALVEPQTATAWLAESYYLHSQSAFEEARSAAAKSTELNPTFGYGYGWLAELEFTCGQASRSAIPLALALEWMPDNAQAITLQGFVYAREHQNEEAYEAFQRAATLDPRSGMVWLGLGLFYAKAGNVGQSLRCLQIATLHEPQQAVLRAYLAKGYQAAAGNVAARAALSLPAHDARSRAREELRRADELDPEGQLQTAYFFPPIWLVQEHGIYLGFDAGLAVVQDLKTQTLTLSPKCELEQNGKTTFNPGIRFDLVGGYRISRAWSVGLEAGMIWNSVDRFLGAKTGSSRYSRPGSDLSWEINAKDVELYQFPLLANVTYRIPSLGPLSGFVGANVGLVVSDFNFDGSSVECYDDEFFDEKKLDRATDVVFAYQALIGLNYAFNDQLSLDLLYKFLGTTDHSWKEAGANLKTDPTFTHAILTSLTYRF